MGLLRGQNGTYCSQNKSVDHHKKKAYHVIDLERYQKSMTRYEAVKYHNDLNQVIKFKDWTGAELNFFFAIIAKARNKGTDLLEFNKEELKEFSESCEKNSDRLKKTFENLERHVMGLRYTEQIDKGSVHIRDTRLLFERFRLEWDDETLDINATIRLSRDYEYILNQLTANFTSFELEEFLGLKSVYAKQLYRYLKQWRTTGRKEFKIDEFKEMLNIPTSYEQRDINKRVMKPCLNELSKCFAGLQVEPIKAKKKGNPVIAYLFTWTAEQTGEWNENKPYTYESNQRKKNGQEVPNWYSDTGGTPPDEALMNEALSLQEKMKAASR